VTLRERYEAGATVESLSLDEGISTTKIRRLLRDEGTAMRQPGGRVGTVQRDTRLRDGIRGRKESPARGRVSNAAKRNGKRRRAKW